MARPGTCGGAITNSRQDAPAARRRLRRALRDARLGIDPLQRLRAIDRIRARLVGAHFFRVARHVAFYDAFDGEVDVGAVLVHAHRAGKRCYLPVLQSDRMLEFSRYRPGDRLVTNRFGLPEPIDGHTIRPDRLDLVLTPLVGFDTALNRIGMGAAYYDTTFAFLRHRDAWRHPKLVGVAFEIQKTTLPPPSAWDVPLWRVVTECGLYAPGADVSGDSIT